MRVSRSRFGASVGRTEAGKGQVGSHNNLPLQMGGLPSAESHSRPVGPPCVSGVGDQPTLDAFGDLGRRCFWYLGRVLAVSAAPVPPSHRLPDEFDAVRRPTTLLQTDADVGW